MKPHPTIIHIPKDRTKTVRIELARMQSFLPCQNEYWCILHEICHKCGLTAIQLKGKN